MGRKKILIGSIIAVALLTLVSFSSVVGYSSVDKNPVPDLDCDGDIYWDDVAPGATVENSFAVENAGDTGSLLDWEIDEYPDWGDWTFTPPSGNDLPNGNVLTVVVTIVAPENPETEFTGEVKIVNSEDSDDFCIIDICLVVKIKSIDDATTVEFKLQRVRDLVQSIDLWKIIVNPDSVVDTLEEVSSILEAEDVRNYIEKSSEEDCGCEEDSSELEWMFPTICTFLYPLWILSVALLMLFNTKQFVDIMDAIGLELNCFWASPE